jgi:hypothetical protein
MVIRIRDPLMKPRILVPGVIAFHPACVLVVRDAGHLRTDSAMTYLLESGRCVCVYFQMHCKATTGTDVRTYTPHRNKQQIKSETRTNYIFLLVR